MSVDLVAGWVTGLDDVMGAHRAPIRTCRTPAPGSGLLARAEAVPRTIAEAILDGVLAGEEDILPGAVAAEMSGTWRCDPKGFEQELAQW